MINNVLMKDIKNALDSLSLFEAEDFVVTCNESYDKTILSIKYIYSDNYQFYAHINRDSMNVIQVSMSPGDLLEEEDSSVSDRGELVRCISKWTKNNDLKANPIVRLIQDQQRYVQEQFDKIDQYVKDIPNEYLTQEEKDELNSRITSIEDNLKQELEEIKEKNSELELQISKVITELETLKQQTSILPKKSLIKSFFIRILKMAKNHPKAMRLIGLSIKQILPKNIKSHIPDAAFDILSLPLYEQDNESSIPE